MNKKSIFSEIMPYLKVSTGLLLVLSIQSNWDSLNFFAGKAGQSVVSEQAIAKPTVAVSQEEKTALTGEHSKNTATTEEGKIKRIKNAVDKLIDTVKEKSGIGGKIAHWGYLAKNGPDKWGELAGTGNSCKTGKAQSPINLVSGQMSNCFEPMFYYKSTDGEILNDGHTLKVIVKPGSFLRVLGKDYQLKQFHFHRMAEHTIDGRRYPMEAHLVHESEQGHIVVVAIMFEDKFQEFNMLVDRIQLPEQAGLKLPITGMKVDPAEMLPPRHQRQYFAYDGSLTTPPCTENVGWIVMKTPVHASLNRINRIGQIMKPNFRPLQPLNGRHVMYSN